MLKTDRHAADRFVNFVCKFKNKKKEKKKTKQPSKVKVLMCDALIHSLESEKKINK